MDSPTVLPQETHSLTASSFDPLPPKSKLNQWLKLFAGFLDKSFKKILASGTTDTHSNRDYTVKVDVTGLDAG